MGTHGDFHQSGAPAGGSWLLNNHPDFSFVIWRKNGLIIHFELELKNNNALDNTFRGVKLIITQNSIFCTDWLN